MRSLSKHSFNLVCVALMTAACSSQIETGSPVAGSDFETTAVSTDSVTTAEAETAPTTDEPFTPTITSTSAAPATGTMDDPKEMGRRDISGFTYRDLSPGGLPAHPGGEVWEWEGAVYGVVETDTDRLWSQADGRCFLVLGTLIPTEVGGAAVSNSAAVPRLTMMTDDHLADDTIGNCDVGRVEAAGYGWIRNAQVTIGTTYPFYAEFFLPDPVSQIEVVEVGSTDDDSVYYTPVMIDEVPEPVTQVGGALAESVELAKMGPIEVSGFTYSDGTTDWLGALSGMVETDPYEIIPEPGSCLVVIGTVVPTAIGDSELSDGLTTPDISVITGGKLIQRDYHQCDTSEFRSAGYGDILGAHVPVDTPYPFFTGFFLPDGTEDIEAVVVGVAPREGTLLYAPTILDAIPTPQPREDQVAELSATVRRGG